MDCQLCRSNQQPRAGNLGQPPVVQAAQALRHLNQRPRVAQLHAAFARDDLLQGSEL